VEFVTLDALAVVAVVVAGAVAVAVVHQTFVGCGFWRDWWLVRHRRI